MSFINEARYYDIFHKNKDYKAEALAIREKFPKAKTVLEVGSGTGLMTVELEKVGFIVHGLEPSHAMIHEAGQNKRIAGEGVRIGTLEDFDLMSHEKFDLVLALYDVLNYVPDFEGAISKMHELGNEIYYEIWPKQSVKPFMYSSVGKYKRLRLGFEFRSKIYLWYLYWGDGFVIDAHKLYMHQQ